MKPGTNLIKKPFPLPLKVFYVVIFFIAVCLGIFYLYGYLWDTFGLTVAESLTRGFYIENKNVACTDNAGCVSACGRTGFANEACLCLEGSCYFVSDAEHFSQNKYCTQDADCTVSCYEGPVSKKYYEFAGGLQRDCSNGCLEVIADSSDGRANTAVCRNHQCQYQNGETCFISLMPRQTE